jgi:hypothetical protein
MAMLQVAFAGTFSATLEPTVRARLGTPCDVILADETGIVSQLSDVDVLITLAFTREMGAAAKRLKLVQVPGAGLDRIDRAALPAGRSWQTSTATRSASPSTCWARCSRCRAASRGSTRHLGGGLGKPGGGELAHRGHPRYSRRARASN